MRLWKRGATVALALGVTALAASLVVVAALSAWSVEGEGYFPPPEAQGGWRKTADPAFIRGLGLDPARLAEFGQYNISVPSYEGRTGALVIKNGWLVGEWYDVPEGRTYLYRLASNGKSVAMLLFGHMVDQSARGDLRAQIGLDSPLYDPAWLPEGFPLSDPRKAAITFGHVFRHTSGIIPEAKGDVRGGTNWDFLPYTVGHDPDYPNSAPLYFDPGTPQQPWGELDLTTGYSSVAFNHLTFVIQRITGMPASDYLRQRLLGPMGVGRVAFAPVQGYEWLTAGGLYMTGRDFARVAYLMLRRGNWDGAQLFPESWLSTFTESPDYPNLRSNVDGHFGGQYPPDMYRTMGSGLNWAFVVPSLDLIAIRVGRTSNSQYRTVEAAFLERLFAAVAQPPAQGGMSVDSFTLIDADRNAPIPGFDPLPDGATIDLAALPTQNLNIRANTSPATVGSVRFGLDGNGTYRTENGAPYTLAGDNGAGDYYAWRPSPGWHTVTATPFSERSAGGAAGTPSTVGFEVLASAAPTPAPTPSPTPTPTPTPSPTPTPTPTPSPSPTPVASVTFGPGAPAAGATVTGTVPGWEARVSGLPAGVTVTQVEFRWRGTLFQTERSAPYCVAGNPSGAPCAAWNTALRPDGTGLLELAATLSNGQVVHASRTLTIDNVP